MADGAKAGYAKTAYRLERGAEGAVPSRVIETGQSLEKFASAGREPRNGGRTRPLNLFPAGFRIHDGAEDVPNRNDCNESVRTAAGRVDLFNAERR